MARTRKKGFVKTGDYMEVRVAQQFTYAQVVIAAAKVVGMQTEEASLVLVRANKTVIPNTPLQVHPESDETVPWTIGKYLSIFTSFTRNRQVIKLGLVYQTSEDQISSLKAVSSHSSESDVTTMEPADLSEEMIEVLYAAVVGGSGLDTDVLVQRFDVFWETRSVSDMGEVAAMKFMDEGSPWHPESAYYAVARILQGDRTLLCAENDGTYTVTGDELGGKLHVVHQSPQNVTLRYPAMPLYCVAFGHTIGYEYQWHVGGQDFGSNTTVLWVNEPGLYSCTVKHDIMTDQCTSSFIRVSSGSDAIDNATPSELVPVDPTPPASSSPSPVLTAKPSELVPVDPTPPASKSPSPVLTDTMEFSNEELKQATNDFSLSHLVGKGGFGMVYCGMFRGTAVAVKVLSKHGVDMLRAKTTVQLQTEVSALRRFSHPNVLTLMGLCTNPPMLVLPFMKQGSLCKRLHQWKVDNPLMWDQRVSVLADTTRGLTYLHSANPPLVHHDINTSNILLDEHGVAKICDFGLSIQLPQRKGGKTLLNNTKACTARNIGLSCSRMRAVIAPGVTSTALVCMYQQVTLETYTGLLAYSEERDDHCLINHCDDALRQQALFAQIGDKKAGVCPRQLVAMFFQVINGCCKLSYKRRNAMAEVLVMWESLSKSTMDRPHTNLY